MTRDGTHIDPESKETRTVQDIEIKETKKRKVEDDQENEMKNLEGDIEDTGEDPDDSVDIEDDVENLPNESSTLYLDTIDRSRLDFDFEKLCSISLSVVNIYACLCCGKYFQGRGKNSFAYLHSVDLDHHVFINLQTLKIYVLPEGYEVKSATLDDIRYVVDPWYTVEQIKQLDTVPNDNAFDLDHKQYYPGFVGINNIKENDYANVILQILCHVAPIRNYLMLIRKDQGVVVDKIPAHKNAPPSSSLSETVLRLATFIRKIWNPKAFKAHVSPHEVLQNITLVSNKRFTPIKQVDPFFFLSWLLNHLDGELSGKGKGGPSRKKQKLGTISNNPASSIITQTFQGLLHVEQQPMAKISQQKNGHNANNPLLSFRSNESIQASEVPFLCLSLDLPPVPLFQGDNNGVPILPQISLITLLAKYNGSTTFEEGGGKFIKRYKIIRLPEFLLFRIKRITRNLLGDADEHNPTVVSFSTTNLNMSPYVVTDSRDPLLYDLIANVVCEWDGNKPRWKVQLLDKSRDQWFQIENLLVEQVRRELLFLNESYIQVWQRK